MLGSESKEAKFLLTSEKINYRNLQIIKRLKKLDELHFSDKFVKHMVDSAPTANDLFVDLCNLEVEYYLMSHM